MPAQRMTTRGDANLARQKLTKTLQCGRGYEYLWKAVWCLFREGDPAAETWVRHHAQQILAGKATRVAGAIKRQATNQGLDPPARAGVDACAAYLTNKAPYLDYPTALASGWPIATGVIEGACRHLVKDRMDITGARWGRDGAEAILKLRAIHSNGDFDQYRQYRTRTTTSPPITLRQRCHPPSNIVPPEDLHPNAFAQQEQSRSPRPDACFAACDGGKPGRTVGSPRRVACQPALPALAYGQGGASG
jgi:hypothetical protein